MTSSSTNPSPPPASDAWFCTTHWSVVVSAGRKDSTRAQAALEQLCQAYWRPLYAYVRRRGHSSHDAEDLTQAFFAGLLQRNAVASADRAKGRFRSFLLASMNHFLADEWDRARAQKRGGGKVFAMDVASAETQFVEASAGNLSPEKLFEQRWAMALLDQVYQRLEQEFALEGKKSQFEQLKFALTGSRSAVPYAELAQKLGSTEAAVKVAVHRIRQRYRELLRSTIADTVASPAEVEAELQHLREALAG